MIKEYQELVLAKKNLREKQKAWIAMLKNEFPALVSKDINSLERKIGDELELLLSSTLRTKTGRILIPLSNSWKNSVVLSRNPGLKHPHESSRIVLMSDLSRINPNGSLTFYDSGSKTVSLQVLKNDNRIIQDRLDKFYEFANRFLGFKRQVRNLICNRDLFYSYSDEEKPVFASLPLMNLNNKFCLKVFVGSDRFFIIVSKNRSEYYTFDSKNFESYLDTDINWRHTSLSVQLDLISVLPQLDSILRNAEEKKAQLVNDLENFLEELKLNNRAFRVLTKLTK